MARPASWIPRPTRPVELGNAHGTPAHLLHAHHRVDYPDQPRTGLVFREDRPRLDRPLPKFLDDAAAPAFMTAAARLPEELDRLMVQILARSVTGLTRRVADEHGATQLSYSTVRDGSTGPAWCGYGWRRTRFLHDSLAGPSGCPCAHRR